MSFIDKVEVSLIAGKGGDGHRSFHRDRLVRKGGPDGGDGGEGGSIIFEASANADTLAAFRYDKELKAGDGQAGSYNKKHGKKGLDLLVKVPVGTQAVDEQGDMIADLIKDGQREIVAEGGKGGFGNAHFVSSSRQAPNFAELGEPGQKLNLTLELKLIADVGLVGLPNAGKSTLLSRLSNARPVIADYPFTTLVPNLGVVDVVDNGSFLIADIPGLIEGAAEGKGLGHKFLRHIERTKLIVHLIDIYSDDIVKNYQVIRSELAAYSKALAKLPEIIVLNKIDGLDDELVEKTKKQLSKVIPPKSTVILISAQAGTNLDKLKYELINRLKAIKPAKPKKEAPTLPVLTLTDNSRAFNVSKSKSGGYIVTGHKIEKFAKRTNFNNDEGVKRLRIIMKRMGITYELNRQGAKPGSKIYFGKSKEDILEY